MPKKKGSSSLNEHEDAIFEMIAGGTDIQTVAEYFGVHRNTLRNWVDSGGEERKGRYDRALEEKGAWHAEQSGKVLVDAWGMEEISQARAGLARDLSKYHQWAAEKLHRRLYGEVAPQINVGFNLGTAHLDALRKVNAPQIPVAEFKELPPPDA